MPPHGGCCEGHEHDESLDDDLGLSLRPYIDLDHVVCLNEEVPHSGKGILKFHDDRLSSHPYVKSNDEDPELLLTIPFTEGVTVKSIAVRSNSIEGVEGSPPLKLKVIGNQLPIAPLCSEQFFLEVACLVNRLHRGLHGRPER